MSFFFFNETATTEIYPLSLHDALPISDRRGALRGGGRRAGRGGRPRPGTRLAVSAPGPAPPFRRSPPRPGRSGARSEEHTSELQSRQYLVCRLLLEKKKKQITHIKS